MVDFISVNILADVLGTSRSNVSKWATRNNIDTITRNGIEGFSYSQLVGIPQIDEMLNTKWDEEFNVQPLRQYNSIELFAGGGGLALGMEQAGFHHIMLNEFDHNACETLRLNRPHWNVVEDDLHNVDFTQYKGKVDFLSGGFPCQAFSYAGKQGGFEDARGTLFFEMARAIKECQPLVFMGENVKGLTSHNDGHTFQVIKNTIKELGYTLVEPRVLKAIMYKVPQKRERIILVAIRNDIAEKVQFSYPEPYKRVVTLRDAFFAGDLFGTDVPESEGQTYPQRKKEIMAMVPEGGDWRNLPEDIQKEYMKGSFYLGGGKTGMARRLALDEPSLTLTCAPAMKQTERCHPTETRPLTVREYARIQTFPDDWQFAGKREAQYKQIGNAVPVNLAAAVGRSLIRLFNDIEKTTNK
jgi:DNA (cytosine-5)-methyltransferase 1